MNIDAFFQIAISKELVLVDDIYLTKHKGKQQLTELQYALKQSNNVNNLAYLFNGFFLKHSDSNDIAICQIIRRKDLAIEITDNTNYTNMEFISLSELFSKFNF